MILSIFVENLVSHISKKCSNSVIFNQVLNGIKEMNLFISLHLCMCNKLLVFHLIACIAMSYLCNLLVL
jgi:hypothetical protein